MPACWTQERRCVEYANIDFCKIDCVCCLLCVRLCPGRKFSNLGKRPNCPTIPRANWWQPQFCAIVKIVSHRLHTRKVIPRRQVNADIFCARFVVGLALFPTNNIVSMRAILLPLTFFVGRWSVFGDPAVTKWTNPINISSPESSGKYFLLNTLLHLNQGVMSVTRWWSQGWRRAGRWRRTTPGSTLPLFSPPVGLRSTSATSSSSDISSTPSSTTPETLPSGSLSSLTVYVP